MEMSRPGHDCCEGGGCCRGNSESSKKEAWKKLFLNPEQPMLMDWPGRAAGRGRSPVLFRQTYQGNKKWKILTCGTLAFITIWVIYTLCPVQTWGTGTVVNIDLANWPSETWKGYSDDTGQRIILCLPYYENDAQRELGCYWQGLYPCVSKCRIILPNR